MQKWKQKTKMLPPSDPFFLFHFYSFASSRSPFPIMLRLRSIVLSLSPSWNVLKDPPQVTAVVPKPKLAWFSLYKARLLKPIIYSSAKNPDPHFQAPAVGKPPDDYWPLLAAVGSAQVNGVPKTLRVSSVFVLQASDGIHAWTVIHHQKGHGFTRWFP